MLVEYALKQQVNITKQVNARKGRAEPVLPSPDWGPGAPGKHSSGLFSEKGGQQPIASSQLGARSARKIVRWTVFREGRTAAPDSYRVADG